MKLVFNDDKSKIIVKESTHEEFHQLKLHLIRKVDNFFFKKRHKIGIWDGTIDRFNNGLIRFGLWKEIYKCCKEHGYKFDIDKSSFPFDLNVKIEDINSFFNEFFKDYRIKPTPDNPEGLFIPYEHQIDAVFNMLKYKYGIIEVATAGGKSVIFFMFMTFIMKFINPDFKFLLIVPSQNLVNQFYDDILDYNNGFNNEQKNPFDIRMEEIMSDKPRKIRDGRIPNLYISTYQSMVNYSVDFLKQFNVVVTDEAHSCKAKSLETILSKTFGTSQYRLGLSGTYPNPNTAEYLTIQSLMGPKLVTVKSKLLMEKGIISNIKINAMILNHNEQEFSDNVFNIKKHGDGKKAFLLEREFIQKSLRRKLFIKKLVNKFNGNSLILFNNVAYGTELYEYLRDNIIGKHFFYIDGNTPAEKRNLIKKNMEITNDGIPKILISSYGTTSTGVNIKAIMNIVFADSSKSDTRIRQSLGRGLRLHADKLKLIVFDLVDRFHSTYDNILYKQYISRRDNIYKKQDFPFFELKFNI